VSSETELIQRAQSGDREAFCLLARSYERRVYSLALHYARNPHDAEDLSQEVWLKAYRAIGSFRGEASFYTWLRQILVHSFLNERRGMTMILGGEKRAIKMGELVPADDLKMLPAERAHLLEEDLHQRMLVERVMRALGELTPQQRLIFLLKHREGMTYEEISQTCGSSTGTIKKALFRAVSKLRERLGVSQTTDLRPQTLDLRPEKHSL
jgi:RNA polymerase sigma-70 factor (ECF subfamily)